MPRRSHLSVQRPRIPERGPFENCRKKESPVHLDLLAYPFFSRIAYRIASSPIWSFVGFQSRRIVASCQVEHSKTHYLSLFSPSEGYNIPRARILHPSGQKPARDQPRPRGSEEAIKRQSIGTCRISFLEIGWQKAIVYRCFTALV